MRGGKNPTREAFEACIADLEGGTHGFGFGSGMAATSTALELLDAGDHIVTGDDLYGGSWRLFERVRRRTMGLDFAYVDLSDIAARRGGDHAQDQDAVGRDAHQSPDEAG